MVVALVQKGWEFDLGRVAAFLATFTCGTAIAYSFMLLLTSLSVWMVRNQSLMEMWWLFSSLARYPKEIFAGEYAGPLGNFFTYHRADPGRLQRSRQRDGTWARPMDGRADHRGRRHSCSTSAAGSSSTLCGPTAVRVAEAGDDRNKPLPPARKKLQTDRRSLMWLDFSTRGSTGLSILRG